MILQLQPMIPMETPKGSAFAFMVTDYGENAEQIWTCAIKSTGEIWSFRNPEVRISKNITFGINNER